MIDLDSFGEPDNRISLFCRRENSELKKEIQDQQDVILGLRRDLAGASARLSDMTGVK